tara:strand:+ start:701 stop:1003 length:303 start_codon:yes stop_codon:yes gene_type:complete
LPFGLISQVAPSLCSAFKGVLPSDLFEKYNCKGGLLKLEFDMIIASEMAERISEQYDEAKGQVGSRQAKKAVARRNQKRSAAIRDQAEVANKLEGWLKDG